MRQRRDSLYSQSKILKDDFFESIIQGDPAKVEELLISNPSLLLARQTVKENSKQSFVNKTPLQLALLRHDFEMAEMIERVFETIEQGRQIKKEQFLEAFPNKLPLDCRSRFDFSKIIKAICLSPPDDNIRAFNKDTISTHIDKCLEKFRASFISVVTSEPFFNPNHFLAATHEYSKYYPQWRYDQSELFWRCVVGFVQRFLPTCDLQLFETLGGIESAVQRFRMGHLSKRLDVRQFCMKPSEEFPEGSLGHFEALHTGGPSYYCNRFYIEYLIRDYSTVCEFRSKALNDIQDRILNLQPPIEPREEAPPCCPCFIS